MAAASMLHATRRRTPPLSAALATAFFASKPQPPPLVSPRLVDAAVSRCPSDALALSFFLWCARRPAYFHPPASFDRILPAATRLASRLRTAPALLRELRAVGCPIRPHTFLLLLRLYWRGGLYPLVLQLFDQMPLWGFHPSVFTLNVALDVHLRTGRLDAALRLLRERDKPSPNYLTYAIFVTHLSRAGDWSGVRNCFISMLQQGFLPSAASLASVFACCSKAGTMSELLQLLSFTLVSGYQLNSAMWTCFIARICREGRLDEACRMLAKMLDSGSSPTVVTYTPLVKGLFQAGRHDKVHELLGSMASTGCSPDLVFYNVLMDCMMKERRHDYALYIYLNLHRSGIKPDAYTLSTLVQVLQLSHNMVLLPRLILGTGISYDLVACNSMLSALCKSGFPSEAIQFYIDMVDVGFRPDSYSYVRCLDSLCQLGRIDHAKSFYHSIVDPNTYVHASILRGLVRSGKNRMALKIFGEAVRQNYALDAVCYTIVLHGLFQAHLVEEACKLFDKMKLLGMASNTCIYNVMLRGLCRTRDMHAVTQLLGEMECAGVQMDSISFNILVVLLIKLRRISSATTLVREMLNLGMKLSTKTRWLLSQSIGHAFIVEDATIAESDASDSTSDLLLYNNVISDFETKINLLKLAHFVVITSCQYPDKDAAIGFLEGVITKLRETRELQINEPILYVKMQIAAINLEKGNQKECKNLLEEGKTTLDSMTDVDPSVHSSFYWISSQCHKARQEFAEFYKNALLYLAYTTVESLSESFKLDLAFDLSLAALPGDNIYSFGELLAHPIINSLIGTKVEWVYHMLQAFNTGNLALYQELCRVHNAALSAQPALVQNEQKLLEKINILCLMEIIFSRPSEDRTIPLSVIAERTKLSISDVECLLMKSLSVHLIEGIIDEVDSTVHVSWVQPRVLGIPQVKALRERLDAWVGKVHTTLLSVEAETPDLVAA